MSRGLLLAAIAIMMAGAFLLLVSLRRAQDQKESVGRRLDEAFRREHDAPEKRHSVVPRWIYQILQRSGMVQHPAQLMMLVVGVGVAFVPVYAFAYSFKGMLGLLAALGVYAMSIYLVILWRTAVTYRAMLEQLPGFVDQIIRTMGIGHSFDSALLQTIEGSPAPLAEALEGVKIETSLGGDMVEALSDTARLYQLTELHLLTLALRINQRYGGSIKSMLESIIVMIRQREQAERELSALTGETRLSAWVLGSLPLAMAGYMMIMNPTYVHYLLDDPSGPKIIGMAFGLQVVGALLLWRMMRSIQ